MKKFLTILALTTLCSFSVNAKPAVKTTPKHKAATLKKGKNLQKMSNADDKYVDNIDKPTTIKLAPTQP